MMYNRRQKDYNGFTSTTPGYNSLPRYPMHRADSPDTKWTAEGVASSQKSIGPGVRHRSSMGLENSYGLHDKAPFRPQSALGTSRYLEHLYFPNSSMIIFGFQIHLDSPLFFIGDQFSGHVIFDVHSSADLKGLVVYLVGHSMVRTYSQGFHERHEQDNCLKLRQVLVGEEGTEPMIRLQPGRYTFPVTIEVPHHAPPTVEVSGYSTESEFQTVVRYSAIAEMQLAVDTIDGWPSTLNLQSQRSVFHLEPYLNLVDLSPLSHSIQVGSRRAKLQLEMCRNIFKPGETIQVHLSTNQPVNFSSADLHLHQNACVPSVQLKQNCVLFSAEGKPFVSASADPSSRMLHQRSTTTPSRCQLELRLPHTLKPECKLKITEISYQLEIRLLYRARKLVSIFIPIRVVRILRTGSNAISESNHLSKKEIHSTDSEYTVEKPTSAVVTHKISRLKNRCCRFH